MFQSKMHLPIGFAVLVLCALSNVQCHLDLDGESVHSTVHYVKTHMQYTVLLRITKTRPCNIQRFFTAVKMIIFS